MDFIFGGAALSTGWVAMSLMGQRTFDREWFVFKRIQIYN